MHETDKMHTNFCVVCGSLHAYVSTCEMISAHFYFQHHTRSLSCDSIRERTHVETVHCDTDCSVYDKKAREKLSF